MTIMLNIRFNVGRVNTFSMFLHWDYQFGPKPLKSISRWPLKWLENIAWGAGAQKEQTNQLCEVVSDEYKKGNNLLLLFEDIQT